MENDGTPLSDVPLSSDADDGLNLRQLYISLLMEDGYSSIESEFIIKHKYSWLASLRLLNEDKLAYILGTKDLSDVNIYLYLIKDLKNKKLKQAGDVYSR